MDASALAALISRIDFAVVTTLHIIYPPLTIGLALLLFLAEWRWLQRGDNRWYRLCRFFERLFIVNFGAGVATGVTMELAFGILYGPFSQAAGPIFGQVLGYETITAFMYEAAFIGLMIFGWGRIHPKIHLFATANVALSSAISAMWIMNANSWMQSPVGVKLQNGYFYVADWFAALLNPNVLASFPHMLLASIELSLCFVIAVCAWFVLKRRDIELFQRPLKYCLVALLFVAPLQIFVGDALGQIVAQTKPAALAAMEGHYNTYLPDGTPNSEWHVVSWPNQAGTGNAWAISIPHFLSLLETHSWNDPVPGLNDFPAADRPPVVVPFYAFRIMAGIGGVLAILAIWGVWLIWRGRFTLAQIASHRWFLLSAIGCGTLPYLAIWAGWWARESARQPWIVYGLMRTDQGVSQMSVAAASFWLVGFTVLEVIVSLATFYYMAKICRLGPSDVDNAPIFNPQNNAGAVPETEAAFNSGHVTPRQ
ncbi:cytochrome ubiquinol oxidase subunit I [Shimwellia pseudoproteus]|uniref:cytochrome ubiquinol oxidase subunit I n=1 Tax=Shimwellia pseudoproteus TaxID=570012 RepID=UPI0018EDE6C5|nr:cytochrome ubiquinol oxidase subunit I [Shimwellia pseudoproteus]